MTADDKGMLTEILPELKKFVNDSGNLTAMSDGLDRFDKEFFKFTLDTIGDMIDFFDKNHRLLTKPEIKFLNRCLRKMLFIGLKANELAMTPRITI